MSIGQDAFRDSELNINEEKEKSENDTSSLPEPSVTPTFERFNYSVSGDKQLQTDLNAKAEAGLKKGVDNLPENLSGNKFPLEIRSPSLEGSLGDWKQNVPAAYGSYPNIDAKSGYTNPPVYPEEISKNNFNSSNLKNSTQPVVDKINTRKQYYNLFQDYAGKQFTHLLDYFTVQQNSPLDSPIGEQRAIPTGVYTDGKTSNINTKDIYLGSFVKTFDDNEDPTMLGYDFKIKTLQSPLFNGSANAFIQQFGQLGNTEIFSREEILPRFQRQFFKFLRTDITNTAPDFNGGSGVKTYYLRKVAGLNRLNDQSDSNEAKQFVDYGKEFITLTFHEDVTQNIGFLASLYKTLSYSRINGKQLLPENLLRFDVEIEITEIRKYNRVFKNVASGNLEFVADKISKYVYTLYECQMFFPNMPHGDTIDMSNVTALEEYEMKFNWKYSTLQFRKFIYGVTESAESDTMSVIWEERNLDNSQIITTQRGPASTNNNAIINGQIGSANPTEDAQMTGGVESSTGNQAELPSDREGELEDIKNAESTKLTGGAGTTDLTVDSTDKEVETPKGNSGPIKDLISKSAINEARENALPTKDKTLPAKEDTLGSLPLRDKKPLTGLDKLSKEASKIFVREVNSIILSQAGLINKSLNNILNLVPGAGGISPPRNVYNPGNRLVNNLTGAIGNFVGNSVRNFFSRR